MLCCDNVLHQVPFNQYWVAMMALFSLRRQNEDSVNLMAVGILSILAAKLNSKQTAKLCSNPRFMTELLNLVRKRIEDVSADITLQFTLSALWNLTDESPLTCELFLKQEGLQLFINLLQTFPENTSVETKVLGLFNNVAEVPKLRYRLLQPQFIAMLRRQIKSEHIAVSYFAAGISAHLVCTGKEAWCQVEDLPFDDLLNELVRKLSILVRFFLAILISVRVFIFEKKNWNKLFFTINFNNDLPFDDLLNELVRSLQFGQVFLSHSNFSSSIHIWKKIEINFFFTINFNNDLPFDDLLNELVRSLQFWSGFS